MKFRKAASELDSHRFLSSCRTKPRTSPSWRMAAALITSTRRLTLPAASPWAFTKTKIKTLFIALGFVSRLAFSGELHRFTKATSRVSIFAQPLCDASSVFTLVLTGSQAGSTHSDLKASAKDHLLQAILHVFLLPGRCAERHLLVLSESGPSGSPAGFASKIWSWCDPPQSGACQPRPTTTKVARIMSNLSSFSSDPSRPAEAQRMSYLPRSG